MATSELIVAPRGEIARPDDVRASDFLPVLTVDESLHRKEQMNLFISKVMRVDEDYGIIPGTKKPTLLKPGAEKLCSMFGLTPQYTADSVIEDWTGENHGGEPMFYYSYRCSLSRGGRFMGEAIGSCSSWESKYRHRWVREDQLTVSKEGLPSRGGKRLVFEPAFAIDKAEITGRFGKPTEYWQKFRDAAAAGAEVVERRLGQKGPYKGYEILIDELQYRVPNPDMADNVNTIQKMAQKRALLAAVLIVTNASDAFTQDMEDVVDPAYPATVPRQEGSGSISSGGELFDNPQNEPEPYRSDKEKALAEEINKAKAAGRSGVVQSPHEAQRAAAQAHFQAAQDIGQAALATLRQQSTGGQAVILDGRPIPEELSVVFKRIDEGERNAVHQAFNLMNGEFEALNLAAAQAEYDDIKTKFRNQFPAGGRKKAGPLDIKICLLDMWDCLKRWEQHKEVNRGGA